MKRGVARENSPCDGNNFRCEREKDSGRERRERERGEEEEGMG